jgi:glycosyltransferase involved in cell wall biosynthesis
VVTATVAVCSRNRVGLLQQCLASLATQVAGADRVEVLVIDNGSRDGTAEFLRSWASRGDGRRSVVEPEPGLAGARNAALDASDRDVVMFVDDDALTPPGWALAHLSAYEASDGVGATGGPVGLLWPSGRPAWITDDLTEWFSALDLGDEPGPFPGPHGPFGTNMAVRRAAALAAGGFDPRLGRVGTNLVSREEADLTRRLRDAGWSVRYEPAAAVVHQVLPERLARRWVLRRGWAQGISNARAEVIAERPGRRTCLVQGAAAARTAVAEFRAAPGDLVCRARALAHAGAAVEFARDAVRVPWR